MQIDLIATQIGLRSNGDRRNECDSIVEVGIMRQFETDTLCLALTQNA